MDVPIDSADPLEECYDTPIDMDGWKMLPRRCEISVSLIPLIKFRNSVLSLFSLVRMLGTSLGIGWSTLWKGIA